MCIPQIVLATLANFWFLKIILLFNLLTMSMPGGDYSRNAPHIKLDIYVLIASNVA
jgi:hypothetical protein